MNNTPLLTQCSYCGRNMSSELNKCPHCAKMVPRMVRCRVCNKDLKNTDAVDEYGVSSTENSYEYFHLDCLESASKCYCPVCNHKITFKELSEVTLGYNVTCPECGHYNEITRCSTCGGYLLSKEAVNSTPRAAGSILHHPACHANNLVEIERQYQYKRRNRLCLICGEKLKLIHWLVGGTAHWACQEREARIG